MEWESPHIVAVGIVQLDLRQGECRLPAARAALAAREVVAVALDGRAEAMGSEVAVEAMAERRERVVGGWSRIGRKRLRASSAVLHHSRC
eukprot:6624834-Prymnesium_polylepis.1